ncbi:M20 family metallopeptidase [Naasia sp. SYSU D00057]|uniref:M20 family metallopeptidase n=1 Tax=Naasia sp. SYSU D00057 TaxID=2817380 RepID=UPI001B314576|nr:M20/M25/M40 family metallo-hydrolase [Naasia sp. SYSU D00057]
MTDVIELAQRLVRTPSPVLDGDEVAVAGVITEALAEAGLPAPQVIAKEASRPNLLTTVGFGPGGSHLVLSGHLDTKPVGAAQWTVDPFGADIDGDRLYGLGSADMKAAVAAMVVAAGEVVRGAELASGKLSLLFTADEENGAEYGAKHVAEVLDLDADGLVIGEPGGIRDDYDSLHVVSRGLGRFTVTARGVQGHSSLSAIFDRRNAGADLADAVSALRRSVDVAIPADEDGLRDWAATVNPGLTYRGGWGYGVLPERMTATVEVRTLPGMTDERLLGDLRSAIEPWRQESGAHVDVDFDDAPHHWIDGTRVRGDDRLVQAVQRAMEATLGHAAPLSVFPGTTDTSWFARTGIPSLPALGPGLLARAHGADEWVSVAAVRKSVDLYRSLIEGFCTSPREDRA